MATSYSSQRSRNTLDDHASARVEVATVSTSLSPDSVRLVRIDRLIASQPNPADKARAQGFYDFMLDRGSQAKALGPRLEVSYNRGWAKGVQRRASLKGKPWYETEKARAGGKWTWRIYREGYHQAEGVAGSEARADQQIEDMKADLMDKYGDWGVPRHQVPLAPAEGEPEDEAAGPRM